MNKIYYNLKKSLLNLPTPINISFWWNYGSLLGLFLLIQIISGFFLSIHYCPNTKLAFFSIIHITQNINNGWLIHNIHINGASFFFICMYMHIGRGIYYSSYKLKNTWWIGSTIFIISMASAFLGYVLPWGQMSFWGATVITNLISTIPYLGSNLTMWIWGGFSINNATLNRFFSFHFILPFIILMLVLLHLYYLHSFGSSNPMGTNSNLNKIFFHIYFTSKDILGFIMLINLFIIIILQYPYMFSDPDNFTPANPLITPTHIQPEWYFLFAYAILRSIPNKLGGVIILMLSLLILFYLPLFMIQNIQLLIPFNPLNQLFFWIFVNNFFLLTWLGSNPIEFPFMNLSQISTFIFFFYFMSLNFMTKTMNKFLMIN